MAGIQFSEGVVRRTLITMNINEKADQDEILVKVKVLVAGGGKNYDEEPKEKPKSDVWE